MWSHKTSLAVVFVDIIGGAVGQSFCVDFPLVRKKAPASGGGWRRGLERLQVWNLQPLDLYSGSNFTAFCVFVAN